MGECEGADVRVALGLLVGRAGPKSSSDEEEWEGEGGEEREAGGGRAGPRIRFGGGGAVDVTDGPGASSSEEETSRCTSSGLFEGIAGDSAIAGGRVGPTGTAGRKDVGDEDRLRFNIAGGSEGPVNVMLKWNTLS